MLADHETGNRKVAIQGQCIICNNPTTTVSVLGKIPFCPECVEVMRGNNADEEISKRMVWSESHDKT